MKSQNNQQETKTNKGNPIYVDIFIITFPFLLIWANVYFSTTWIDKQANIKTQNPKNIKQSCLHFAGYYNTKYAKNNQRYSVDGIIFDSSGSMGYLGDDVGNPMTAEKHRQFYDDVDKYQYSKC